MIPAGQAWTRSPDRQEVMSSSDAGLSLADGWELSGLSRTELWLRYMAVGGDASPARMAGYTRGQPLPGCYQHNLIAQALNDHFCDQDEDHPVGYQVHPSPS